MKRLRASHDGTAQKRSRKHRPRPLPKWLTNSTQLEAIARSRCLMVLSVLSGETPVTDAISQAKISRGTYYQLETRALKAMLTAMNPLAGNSDTRGADLSAASGRIAHLQSQLKRLEQEKRRSQRLLLLMRKSMRAPVTTGHRGRWPKALRSRSSALGESASIDSSERAKSASPPPTGSPTPPGARSP